MTPFKRILITGTGRSGTFFVHRLFQSLGLKATHEIVYGPGVHSSWPEDVKLEASWLAVPRLNRLPEGTLVLHQVRNPVLVGRSFLGRDFFKPGDRQTPYMRFVSEHEPSVYQLKDPRIRFMRYYLTWNRAVEKHAGFRYRVEDLDHQLIEHILGELGLERSHEEIANALSQTSKKLNSGPKGGPSFGWNQLPVVRESHDFLRLAQKYGYATYVNE